jgi:hypothetical protein
VINRLAESFTGSGRHSIQFIDVNYDYDEKELVEKIIYWFGVKMGYFALFFVDKLNKYDKLECNHFCISGV